MSGATADQSGWLYVIQLYPGEDSGVIKIGWTTNVEKRLLRHRAVFKAPGAVVLSTWPCQRKDEWPAIFALVTGHCETISPEVYRASDIGAVIERGRLHFSGDGVSLESHLALRKASLRPTVPELTAQQLHERYGVSVSTVYYLVNAGRLPATDEAQPYHTRRRLKFRLSDVERVFGGKDKPAKRD